jgi:hypothetical protein
MLPSILKNSNPMYLYDEKTKELLYVSASQVDMARILGFTGQTLFRYKEKQIKYLGRFMLSNTTLNREEYSVKILDTETLQEFVKEIATKFTHASQAIRIEVLDLDTDKTTIYPSANAAAKALNIKQQAISMYFKQNQQKPYKKRYVFRKL